MAQRKAAVTLVQVPQRLPAPLLKRIDRLTKAKATKFGHWSRNQQVIEMLTMAADLEEQGRG